LSYETIDIDSSYRENDLGRFIYNSVIRLKPKKVVEFGTLNGYSAVAIAMGLRDNGFGKLYAYDLWEKYPYKSAQQEKCRENIERYSLENLVVLGQVDFKEWLKNPEDFDLLHIDISNTGDVIKTAVNALRHKISEGSTIIFEGGSSSRDNVEWMVKYNKKPIYPLRKDLGYEILCEDYPSISIIENPRVSK
jgi:predicted O-methyltransferase YrrM